MKKKILVLPTILFLSILFIFFYLLIINRNPSEIPSALINKKVPDFITTSLIKKNDFISKDIFGKEKVIVNFFATWCKPCLDEHEYIMNLSKKTGVKIIGINYKDNRNNTIKWLKKLGNPYSIIAEDKNGNVAIDWGVYGIPETFIVDSKGIIKYRHIGPINKTIYKRINLLVLESK